MVIDYVIASLPGIGHGEKEFTLNLPKMLDDEQRVVYIPLMEQKGAIIYVWL